MATRKKRTAKKRTTKKRASRKPAAPPPSTGPDMLDLTAELERPTVRLEAGDYKMRLHEELTFDEFALQVRTGKEMEEKSSEIGTDGVLEELQAMIVKSSMIMLVGLDPEAAATITPGQYGKILHFFNKLGSAVAATPSESG